MLVTFENVDTNKSWAIQLHFQMQLQLPSLLGKKLGGEIYEKFSRLRGDEGPSILHVLLLPLWKSEEHWGTIRVEKTRVKKSKMADNVLKNYIWEEVISLASEWQNVTKPIA